MMKARKKTDVERLSRSVALAFLAGATAAVAGPALAVEAVYRSGEISYRADTLARQETVLNRPRPDYDPLGIELFAGPGDPAGIFTLYPQLDLQAGWEDNVFRTDTGEVDDFLVRILPQAVVRSNWDNHALNFGARGDIQRYEDQPRNDHTNFQTFADGRLDVLLDTAVYAAASWGRFHEERNDPNSASPALNVNRFYLADEVVGVETKQGDFLARLEGQFRQYNYEDNGPINNDDRDRHEYAVRARLGYEFQPGVTAFVQPSYSWSEYEDGLDDNGFDRDSEGWDLRGGLSYEVSGVTYAEVTAGYFDRSYDDPTFSDASGFAAGAEIVTNPTDFMTLSLGADRSVVETTLPGISGIVRSEVDVGFDYEILDNLLFNSDGGWRRDDFEGSPRRDNTWSATVGLVYLINEYFSVSAAYDFEHRDSNVPGQDFTSNGVFVTLRGQL